MYLLPIFVSLISILSLSLIGCSDTDIAAYVSLRVNNSNPVEGETVILDASDSQYHLMRWRMNRQDLPQCNDLVVCEITLPSAGSFEFQVVVSLDDSADTNFLDSSFNTQAVNNSNQEASDSLEVIARSRNSNQEDASTPDESTDINLNETARIPIPADLPFTAETMSANLSHGPQGESEQSYLFDGQNDQVKGTWGQPLSSEVSLVAWFRSSGGGGSHPRILEFSDASGHYSKSTAIAYDRDGSLRAWSTCELTNKRMAEIDYSAERYNDNKWHLATYVFDGTEGRLYVDGVLKQVANDDVCADVVDAQTFVIGSYYQNTSHTFNGSVSKPRFFDVVLTEVEIEALYDQEKPPAPAPPPDIPISLSLSVSELSVAMTEGPQSQVNAAYLFDGQNDYVRGTWSQEFTSAVSLVAWFRSSGGGGSHPRILEFSDASGHYSKSTAIAYDRDGSLRAWSTCELTNKRMAEVDYSAERYNDNEWHHVAYVFDGTDGRLYVDGELKQVANDDVCADVVDAQTFVMGSYYQNTSHTFKGAIAKPQIYHGAFSAEEVQQLYQD